MGLGRLLLAGMVALPCVLSSQICPRKPSAEDVRKIVEVSLLEFFGPADWVSDKWREGNLLVVFKTLEQDRFGFEHRARIALSRGKDWKVPPRIVTKFEDILRDEAYLPAVKSPSLDLAKAKLDERILVGKQSEYWFGNWREKLPSAVAGKPVELKWYTTLSQPHFSPSGRFAVVRTRALYQNGKNICLFLEFAHGEWKVFHADFDSMPEGRGH